MSARIAALLAVLALAAGVAAKVEAGGQPQKPEKPKSSEKRDLEKEEALRKEALKAAAKYAKELEPVLRFAAEKKLKKQAEEVLAAIETAVPDSKKLPELKDLVEKIEPSGEPAEANLKEFARKLESVKDAQGKRLMALAKSCAKVGLYTRCYDLVGEVLDLDPDNAEARKIRGFVKKDGRWVSKFEAQLMKDNVLYKDKQGVIQGWVPKKDVKKWDEGLRPFAGGWLPEEQEIQKRQQNEYRGWSVESEHFEVKTGVSRAAAYEWGQFLEDYYDAFFRNFLNFFDVEDGAKLLFDVKPLKKKHIVICFQDRNRYLQHVKAEHGNERILLESAGFFGPCGSIKCSHFYKTDDDESIMTMLHECTHQLFDETKEERSHGSQGNNWVVEGIASYIETWQKVGGKWVPGRNTNHGRLQIAKQFLAQNPGWKLSDFLAIGNKEFHEQNRGLNYCLAEALSHFLMHYDNERYREDFVRFIAVYYEGKARENSLYEHLQIPGPEAKRAEVLEAQFKDYMSKLGEGAAAAGERGGDDDSN